MPNQISAHFIGIKAFEEALDFKSLAVQKAGKSALAAVAAEVEREAKDRAPVKTGRLRSSIQMEPVRSEGMGWSTKVYPTTVYARRIEMGFHGADSLGRQYNQQGQPYLGPAVRSIKRRASEIFAARWEIALRA